MKDKPNEMTLHIPGLEINGCPGARGTEILRWAPRFLRLGAR